MNKPAILSTMLAPLILLSVQASTVQAKEVSADNINKAKTTTNTKTGQSSADITKSTVKASKVIKIDTQTQDSLTEVKKTDTNYTSNETTSSSASSVSTSNANSNDKKALTGDDSNSSSSSSTSDSSSSSSNTTDNDTVTTSPGETAVSINGVPSTAVSTVTNSDNINGYVNSSSGIIKTAMSLRGIPYLWGGTTTSGFDCSGYVQYVFNKNGISLPRTAAQQASATQNIPLSEAKAGDLLFWGDAGSEHHVAIYLGNNQFIDADMPGDVINVRNIYPSWLPTHAGRVN